METITHIVGELTASDRSALERFVGHPLQETERVVLNVLAMEVPIQAAQTSEVMPADIPEHWKVYEGLSVAEVDDISRCIVRERSCRSIDI
jgi:hypothetical protein